MFRKLALAMVLGLVGQIGFAQSNGGDGGQVYRAGTYGDWELRCTRFGEGQPERCNLYQLLRLPNGNPVAEFSMIALPAGNSALVGANITTPLETLLPPGLRLSVDGNEPKRYEFSHCTANGCIVRAGFSALDLVAFEDGSAARIVILPVSDPGSPVEILVSLRGFTQAYDALLERYNG